jgi:hypothetical protein
MTVATTRTAVAWFCQFAVRSDASLRVQTPEQAVVARLHSFIVRGGNELSLPPQSGTEVGMVDVEACFTTMNHD